MYLAAAPATLQGLVAVSDPVKPDHRGSAGIAEGSRHYGFHGDG